MDIHGKPVYSSDSPERIAKAKEEEYASETDQYSKDRFYSACDPTYHYRKYKGTKEQDERWSKIDNIEIYKDADKELTKVLPLEIPEYDSESGEISESDFDDEEVLTELHDLKIMDYLQQIKPTKTVQFGNYNYQVYNYQDVFDPNPACLEMPRTELQQVSQSLECLLLGGNRGKGKARPKKRYAKRGKPKRRLVSGLPTNLKPNDIMRPSFRSTLNYFDPTMQIAAPTQSFVVRSLRINDYFDPDPLVLTTGYAGFADLMSFYEFFRVDHTQVIWEPSNNETFQVAVGYVFSQTNLNLTLTTRQLAIDALENGISSKPYTLQQRNGGKSDCNIIRALDCKALLGDPSLYKGDVNYTGTAVASPADQLWVNLIVIAPTNLTLLLNGVVGSLAFRSRGLLFGRITLDDPRYAEHRLRPFTSEQLATALKAASEKEASRNVDKRRLK